MKTAKANPKTPKLRHHKATGQAYAVLNGRPIYFGLFGTSEANQNYHRTITEWLAGGAQRFTAPAEITINEMLAHFWVHAQNYYRDSEGRQTSELGSIRLSVRHLCELYGLSKATDFGPRGLKTVRKKMITMGWCRNNINRSLSRIKMIFKWAAAEEMISGSIYHALMTVPGLKSGRTEARESDPVKPVPQEYVDAVQPYVSRQVWAIIQLQLLTAARPTEILTIRPCDIDRSGRIWAYSPAEHKTAHHGHQRKIYIGPKGQQVLRPFLMRPNDAYCFSPAEAEAERRIRMHENRQTYLSCGNVPGSKLTENPARVPGQVYDKNSYRVAIARAIEKAFPAPLHLRQLENETKQQWEERLTKKQKAELKGWYKQFHWHPHQLRHNAATYLRKEFGLETARIILGHRSAAITEVYAEMDQQKALDAIIRVG